METELRAPLVRIAGWEKALADYLRDMRRAKYHPTRRNCAQFVADAVSAMTARDLRTELGLHWDRQDDIDSTLKYGLESLLDRILAPTVATYGRRGDIVIVPSADGRGSLALIDGSHALALSRGGLVRVLLDARKPAWKVG